MAGSVFDSPLFARLFPTGEVGRLFTDSAEIRAMLLVEGMLAGIQADLGIIPKDSGAAIVRASREVQIDPDRLAQETGRNGVSVPALVAAFRAEMQAPEHAGFIHWGATSQDILDTGLMLRLRQALALIEDDLAHMLEHLAGLADTHAETPMMARSYGQHATPTGFGAVVAEWGAPLVDLLNELGDLRHSSLLVSLSGAGGTSAALGPRAGAIRAGLAQAAGLSDPGRSWHNDRGPLLRIAGWMLRLCAALRKMAEDAIELARTEIAELATGSGGSSSTMPQKQNPVAASALAAIALQNAGLFSVLQGAASPRHQRDGTAWFSEWMCLPQIVLGTASAAAIGAGLAKRMQPDPTRMARVFGQGLGLAFAEALSFALAGEMPRTEAQSATKLLCREAVETATHLRDLALRDHPRIDPDLFGPARQLGQASSDARAFARAARAALGQRSED